MKILAIETSTIAGSVALLDDETGLIGEVRSEIKVAHAERLMPSIEWLFRTSNVSVHEIDAFAISIGPGSFTGLRIGLSAVKGFAFATGKPVVAVPTLDAFARTIPFCSYLICPIFDARKSEVYAGLYRWEGDVCRKVMAETATSPVELLKCINEKTVFTGEGVKRYKDLISEKMRDNAIFAPASRMSPSASSVAELAAEKLREGMTADPSTLTPFYIRRSEAEIHWKG